MPGIYAASTVPPPFIIRQEEALVLTRTIFQKKYKQIERLLKVFPRSDIEKRHVCMPMSWYQHSHSLKERNDLYIQYAVQYGVQAIQKCLTDSTLLQHPIAIEEIDAIFFISSTGISTPSIDAKIMNELPFSNHTKRIPIWGLGCAGGAAGISRAYDYCLAHPTAKVLILAIEFCSLTFQKEDLSKSNLVGTSLFSDGVACALVAGNETNIQTKKAIPKILGTQSVFKRDSEDIMGWNVGDNGLHVVFSKNIPSLIRQWLGPVAKHFLSIHNHTSSDVDYFIAHPGGKKILHAYMETFHLEPEKLHHAKHTLRDYGNMSSPTIIYVLKKFLEEGSSYNTGLIAALGPGFGAELLLLKWE